MRDFASDLAYLNAQKAQTGLKAERTRYIGSLRSHRAKDGLLKPVLEIFLGLQVHPFSQICAQTVPFIQLAFIKSF